MNRTTRTILLSGVIAMAGAGAASAQTFAVGANIGTTGGGVEAQASVSPILTLRGGYTYFEYGFDETYDDIDFDADLDLSNFSAFVDLHPFSNGFLVSGGAYFGDKGIDLDATPTGPTQIGDVTVTPEQVGTITGRAEMDDAAPFIGLGWDSTFYNSGPWGWKVIAGAMFAGSPTVELDSTGGQFSDTPEFQAELDKEAMEIQAEIDDYDVYPVVQLGVTYTF